MNAIQYCSDFTEKSTAVRTMVAGLWEALGCDSFVESYAGLISARDWALQYVYERLTSRPNDFSDNAVKAMRLRKDELGELARTILRERLESFAEKLPDKPAELSADSEQLKQSIRDFGFSADLNEILAKVESVLDVGDAFDQAATLKHLRTFFEHLHREAAQELHRRKPDTLDGTNLYQCGNTIDHLVAKDVLTPKMQLLTRALYGVLSNEGVHQLKAEREYVRLCWNMVVEYSKILFF